MSDESTFHKPAGTIDWVTDVVLASGQLIALLDGRVGIYAGLNAAAIGDTVALVVSGRVKLAKVASVVMLPGQRIRWDESASNATHELLGDYDVGICIEDAAAAATEVLVELNALPRSEIELGRTGFAFATTESSGAPGRVTDGGKCQLTLDVTTEAQRSEALSEESVDVVQGFITSFIAKLPSDPGDAAVDYNIGMANAGHASDAESITEFVGFHFDGNTQLISAQSRDGTTTVAVVDTTIVWVADAYQLFQIDARNLADIQLYIDGVLVLPSSVFRLDNATGPMKLLQHMEKSSAAVVATLDFKSARVQVVN